MAKSDKKKAEKRIEELRFKHQCYAEYLGAKQTDARNQLNSLTKLMLETAEANKELQEIK